MSDQKFNCINSIDKYIRNEVKNLSPGVIGMLAEYEINLKGRLLTKGYFPRWCIRYEVLSLETKNKTKSLACYSGEMLTLDSIKHLPVVK